MPKEGLKALVWPREPQTPQKSKKLADEPILLLLIDAYVLNEAQTSTMLCTKINSSGCILLTLIDVNYSNMHYFNML